MIYPYCCRMNPSFRASVPGYKTWTSDLRPLQEVAGSHQGQSRVVFRDALPGRYFLPRCLSLLRELTE